MSFAHGAGVRVGRYELVRRLGEGGMGVVWEATLHGPQGFTKPVALKLLREGPPDPEREQVLVREARVGALLSHPNIVSTLDLGRAEDTWYIAMELVRGVSAGALVRQQALSPLAVIEVGVQAAAGLAHLHGLQRSGVPLVHRDIKPANLLIDHQGLVKVADLGIASAAGVGESVGTPGYLAPEQARGRAEPRSDLFALGVTLVVLATRVRPFGRGVAALAALADVEGNLDPDVIRRLEEAVPGLGAVVARCLRADPGDRWRDAEELGSAIGALMDRQPGGPTLQLLVAAARPDLPIAPGRVAVFSSLGDSSETVLRAQGNLPPRRDRFVGRHAELAALAPRVQGGQAVVVMGLGGMGKTRLALETARRLQPDLRGGAWFFDVSEARSALGLCAAVARGLGLVLTERDPVEQVGRALAARHRALFVLDNLEQVAEEASGAVARWRALAPAGLFLCTSRVALHGRGIHRFALGPLSVEDGVALFVARAPDIAVDDALRALVQDVEAMPLALELLAARARLMTVQALRERLADRFRLLAGRGEGRPTRHRSVLATLEGSWELLSPWARAALAQLTAFEGGWTLDAAEAVVDLSPWPEVGWVLDVLDELVDASVIAVDPEHGRMGMPVLVQALGRARLTAEEHVAVEVRHGAFFAQMGSPAALASSRLRSGRRVLDSLFAELDNLVAASRRAVARGDGAVAASTALAAANALDRVGPVSAVEPLLRAAHAVASGSLRADLEIGLATAIRPQGRVDEARSLLLSAMASLPEDDRSARAGSARSGLALLDSELGRHAEAECGFETARAMHRARGDLANEGVVLGNLAGVYRNTGRSELARATYDEALARHRQVGNAHAEAAAVTNIASLDMVAGKVAPAMAAFEAALALFREVGDRSGEAMVLVNVGLVHALQGEPGRSAAVLQHAVALQRARGTPQGEVVALARLGEALMLDGRPEEARACYERVVAIAPPGQIEIGYARLNLAVIAVRHGVGGDPAVHSAAAHQLAGELNSARLGGLACIMNAVVRALAGDEAAREDLAEGERLLEPLEDPGSLVVAACARAEVEHWLGDASAASGALDEAERRIAAIGSSPGSELAEELARVRVLLGRTGPADASRGREGGR